jgi:hypothetical protein
MRTYIVLYHHKHGVTPCLMRTKKEPTEEQMAAALKDIGEEVVLSEKEYVEAVLAEEDREPALNKRKCDEGCPGWGVFNAMQVQRCDVCGRFDSDEEAAAYVLGLEAIDIGRHLEASAQRALIEIRNQLAAVVEEAASNPAVATKKLTDQLEVLLGRSFWLERHRWSEHSLQFARLLSELRAAGEVVEDMERLQEFRPPKPGYFLVKIADLEVSMGLPWLEIRSIFERADAVFPEG